MLFIHVEKNRRVENVLALLNGGGGGTKCFDEVVLTRGLEAFSHTEGGHKK